MKPFGRTKTFLLRLNTTLRALYQKHLGSPTLVEVRGTVYHEPGKLRSSAEPMRKWKAIHLAFRECPVCRDTDMYHEHEILEGQT